MPRKARMYLPGIPAHVVQRGNNRGACFFSDEDLQFYRECFGQGLRRHGVKLHAYALMTNHVHLLMTPEEDVSISRLMQHVGRLYVLYVNKTYRRSGTLFEGHHKASLVAAEDYLLTCYRYIEMNPVVAGMVAAPELYRWSSYRHHAWGQADPLIEDHELYLQLDRDPARRQHAYRELFKHQIPEAQIHEIRERLAYNFPLGNDRFRDEIETALGRRVGERKRGRPSKQREMVRE
jgi:putative transposase